MPPDQLMPGPSASTTYAGSGRVAAIDRNGGAGHLSRLLRGEKPDQRGNLLRLRDPTGGALSVAVRQRRGMAHAVARPVLHQHRGIDVAGADRVDAHTLVRMVHGHGRVSSTSPPLLAQ